MYAIGIVHLLISFALALASTQGYAQSSPADWQQFQQAHVRGSRTTEGLGVGATTSEGQGLAMLRAVAADDRSAFDALWTFAQLRLLQPSGLLAWKWEPQAGVVDSNNAALGDLYVAWALQQAASAWRWPSYAVHAERMADALLDRCVAFRDGRAYLLPAATGFTTDRKGSSDLKLNPSHWALPALRSFRVFERGVEWQQVYASALEALPSIAQANDGHVPVSVVWSRGAFRPTGSGSELGDERVSLFLDWAGELPQLTAALRPASAFSDDGSLYRSGLRFLQGQSELAGRTPSRP